MPPPDTTPDEEPNPDEREGRRPAWWRRALAFLLRGLNRRLGGAGNPQGAGRDLLPDRFRRGR
jgi:hypothetical protein